MLIAKDTEKLQQMLTSWIIDNATKIESRYGTELRAKPILIVSEKSDADEDTSGWRICDETYLDRILECIDDAIEKLSKVPYTRRVSIPIWRPKDHFCNTPPAITEISFLFVDNRLHATAFLRSLDAVNYFKANFGLISYVLEEIAGKTGNVAGSVAMLIAAPHIYQRDVHRVEKTKYKEHFGYHDLGVHIVEDYLSSAWHSALETVYYQGKTKRTEWGDLFEGQGESKFVHRLFLEIKNPEENQIHDKAPFTKKYGIDYAHEYVMFAASIDKPVKESILKVGESYTYAERARFCERDEVRVDQLYTVIEKLRKDKSRRDCYVGISRPWDIKTDDPPCLRGYQFVLAKEFSGIFYMRSNDVYGAMHANMFAFNLLTKYVAELIGFDKHTYYHFSLDAHIYNEFLDAVKDILEPSTPSFSDFL